MIFAFGDDACLTIYESAAEAILQWEGIDVESGAVHFYDERGTFLEPRFIKPNRSGKLLRLIGWVESGIYELVPNPDTKEDPFALALFDVRQLNPNKWFSSLEQVKTALSAQGVPVEYHAKETGVCVPANAFALRAQVPSGLRPSARLNAGVSRRKCPRS